MRVLADIDIDFADRNHALENLIHVPASLIKNNQITKHNTGVYFQDVPVDPVTGYSSLDHNTAKDFGYFKLDFLNLQVYKEIKSREHLLLLQNTEPLWEMLDEQSIVDELFHLNGNFEIVQQMKPKSIEELAVVLAIKIPCKRHLIGKDWQEIHKEVWRLEQAGVFQMKKSHAIAYAMVVVIQMNLMIEKLGD